MSQWDISNINTLLLSTQTDADSPWSQFVADKFRLMIEQQILLNYDSGHSGSIQTVSSGGNTVLHCAASSYGADDFNGLTILITTGLAKGFMYTIDDVSTSTGGGSKLTMTGDDLDTDGVRANDTYKILYDQLVNTDGHDHDGTNSKNIDVPMFCGMPGDQQQSATTAAMTKDWYFYKQAYHDTLHWTYEGRSLAANTYTVVINFGSASTSKSTNNNAYSTFTDSLDISGEGEGWKKVRLRTYQNSTAGSYDVVYFGCYVI